MATPYKGTPDEGRYMTDAEFRMAALPDWSDQRAMEWAAEKGLQLGAEHLKVLFPGGLVSQGCRLAGLPAPPYSKGLSFGSVQ